MREMVRCGMQLGGTVVAAVVAVAGVVAVLVIVHLLLVVDGCCCGGVGGGVSVCCCGCCWLLVVLMCCDAEALRCCVGCSTHYLEGALPQLPMLQKKLEKQRCNKHDLGPLMRMPSDAN